ncbi:MAG: tRNA preQ1(34) S-adenosylmethionine ribosyltransferase-isomerase QueA [Deltaproteobacteria bacterium]|nr:tRNA preQ1(34) S-adenosylmethionine ribosyltransferase-isomerase QueA [Deltaproteobacteria bacterium]
MFHIADYDYVLPGDLIAQVPVMNRDQSRLLLVEREKKSFSNSFFSALPGLLKPGDLLVANDTKVVPARLFGRKESGGQVEILVLKPLSSDGSKADTRWCLLKSSKRPKRGSRLIFENDISATVEELGDDGQAKIHFHDVPSVETLLQERGTMPLPPYIKRDKADNRAPMDRERYQTVFALKAGAVAAPTAGLHFTEELITKLARADISLHHVTLHVGPGTFRPVKTRDIREHVLEEEWFSVDPDTAEAINRAKMEGRRVIAVGTTVVRTLESVGGERGEIISGEGTTGLYITPGFRFNVVSGMITNFHLPRSSLLFLVSALAGRDLIKKAYQHAIEEKYRFYSYGDAMLIL